MFESIIDATRRLAGMRNILLLALGVLAGSIWMFTRGTENLAGYTEARKQTWISPERIAYVKEIEAKVTQIELDVSQLATDLLKGDAKTKTAREARIAELRISARDAREKLTNVKHATNDALDAAKAELEKAVESATSVIAAARAAVPAPPVE